MTSAEKKGGGGRGATRKSDMAQTSHLALPRHWAAAEKPNTKATHAMSIERLARSVKGGRHGMEELSFAGLARFPVRAGPATDGFFEGDAKSAFRFIPHLMGDCRNILIG